MNDYLSVVYNEDLPPYTECLQKLIQYLFNAFQLKEGMKTLEPGCSRGEHLCTFQDLDLDVYLEYFKRAKLKKLSFEPWLPCFVGPEK